MPPASAVPEPEASRTTPAPGSTGLGVAVSFATERGAQLAGAIRSVQLLTRPISDSLGSVTNSRQLPSCESPANTLRSPSALNVPVYGAAPSSRLCGQSCTSSVPVKGWPAAPRPALTSGTVVTPSGALSASERCLMSGCVRLPMFTRTSSTIPGSVTLAVPA
jgi:hypothetical protein